MKFDPGIHIVMHSVLSLKPGVTGAGVSVPTPPLLDLAFTNWKLELRRSPFLVIRGLLRSVLCG